MARKQSRYNGNRNGGKVITKCEDTQPRQVFEIGDNIWVKIHESSWWPAQVVDKNALGGSNEINDGEEGKVLARLYGSYEYLYVDPMKYRSEFQNILKQHNNSVREILQKALEQDLSQIKIGAKLKGKASQSEENAKPKASKDTNGKRVCLKRKQEVDCLFFTLILILVFLLLLHVSDICFFTVKALLTSFNLLFGGNFFWEKPLDAIGQRTRGKWNRLLENKAGDRAKEGKMTMHEAKQLNPDEAKQQQKTEESVEKSLCRVSKNLKRGGVKKKQEADRLVTANQLKKDGFTRKQKPATLSLENGLKQGRVKEQQKDDKLCFANGVGQDKVKKKQKGDTPNSLSMQRYLSTEHTVTETSASPRQGGHERKRKAEKLDIVSVSETSKSLRQDGRKRKKAADKLDTVTVSGTSRSLRKNARKQEADTPNSAAVNEASESLSQDVSKRKKVADKPDSVTVSGTSRSLRKDGYKRKQAAEKPDAITVSKSSKSLRKDGPKGKQETHKPDTITVNGTSKTPRRDGCDRKHETDKPDTANDLKHSEDVNEKSKSTSSNLANSLLKGCQELSARRTKVMQSLGLVAPSGSPFSKVVLSKS